MYYTYIYIYIERERERERENLSLSLSLHLRTPVFKNMPVCVCVCVCCRGLDQYTLRKEKGRQDPQRWLAQGVYNAGNFASQDLIFFCAIFVEFC